MQPQGTRRKTRHGRMGSGWGCTGEGRTNRSPLAAIPWNGLGLAFAHPVAHFADQTLRHVLRKISVGYTLLRFAWVDRTHIRARPNKIVEIIGDNPRPGIVKAKARFHGGGNFDSGSRVLGRRVGYRRNHNSDGVVRPALRGEDNSTRAVFATLFAATLCF